MIFLVGTRDHEFLISNARIAASGPVYDTMSPSNNLIVKDPDILGGTPVFRGTRVRVQALFDSLESGETLEGFLEGFPSVTREMAITALEQAKEFLSNPLVADR